MMARAIGDIALQMAHAEVVGAVEHAAVGVAAAVNQVAVALGRRHEHAGAVKVLGDQGLGGLGAEVAEEDHQRVAAGRLDILHRLEHVELVLDRHGALVQAALADLDNRLASGDGQADGEAVARDGDNTELYFRNVGHHDYRSSLILIFTPRSPMWAPFFASLESG